jgi:hypothetical protein
VLCLELLTNGTVAAATPERGATGGDAVAHVSRTSASMVGRGEIKGLTQAETPAGNRLADAPLTLSDASMVPADQILAPPPTPSPIYAFSSGTTSSTRVDIGGWPADSNVAASRTHICITTRGAFACYTKSGLLVSPGQGLSARPYTAQAFFTASGLPIGTPNGGGTDYAKDARIVFDHYRKRFFMDFETREPIARLMIAVSKSEDPRDGWWTYADVVGTATYPFHDYQWVGVNASWFLVSDPICPGAGNCPITKHFMYPAGKLASGQAYVRSAWTATSNGVVISNGAVPCDHDTFTNDSFYVDREDDTHVNVWAVRSGTIYRRTVSVQTSTNAINGPELGGGTVIYTNIGRTAQNCEYRNGRIVFVSNDGHTWGGQSTPNNAIRLVRLNVSGYFNFFPIVTVEIDRIFGKASASDPPGSVFDYGWPAVATNGNGDIVIGEIRSNASIYPEIRGSVWFAGQSDISSGVSVQASSSPLGSYHMAGASADPSTLGVYISQQYGSTSPGWRIRVAKILGKLAPDLIAVSVQAPATLHHGQTYTAYIRILNQGDATMPASQATLRLSTDRVVSTTDTLLKTFSVPSLAPSQITPVAVTFKVPAQQPAGNYFLGPMLDSSAVASEYSETNNQNPFLAGAHGNLAEVVD